MPATIKDVARKANVSIATVSLVLHNHQRISPTTRRRVLKAISDLNYHPSHQARGLVMRQTNNIGFLLTNDHFLRTEPFYTHIFLGTEFEARDHDYYILLNSIPSNFNACDHLPRFILERNVDGVIIAGKVPDELVACMETFDLPVVFVDYYPQKRDYCAVLIDNVAGGEKATTYLIERGHRRIGFIGGDMNHPSLRDRYQGFEIALNNAGIAVDDDLVITSETATNRQSGAHAAMELLRRKKDFSAVFACNDAMAMGAMQAFRDSGLRIPEDRSIIGFDDVTADMLTDPPLSSMRVPKIELGVESLRLILELLKNKTARPRKILVPVELIERQSVDRLN
jgi:LacI family transcriptional regulator